MGMNAQLKGIGPPFCFHLIPTYRVLSHSMIRKILFSVHSGIIIVSYLSDLDHCESNSGAPGIVS